MPANVVLIGFSGTGKSAVGRVLAPKIGWSLVDTDDLIIEQFGKSIAAVFRDAGEASFREAERAIVSSVCQGHHQVISVGGGAPVDLESRGRIRDGNLVVRLEASPETILRRLQHVPGAEERPMVAGPDPLGRIRRLLVDRAAAYAIADVAVNTEATDPRGVADIIVAGLNQRDWIRGKSVESTL